MTKTIEQQRKLNILVVEDTERHIMAAKHYLKSHSLKFAETFQEAWNHLASRKNFDVLLTDLFFPYGVKGSSHDDCWDELPLGYAISLYVARRDVPRIAILTDCNHHSNSVASTFDAFRGGDFRGERNVQVDSLYGKPVTRPVFVINNSYFCMFDERDLPGAKDPVRYDENKNRLVPCSEKNVDFPGVKRWGNALDAMMSIK